MAPSRNRNFRVGECGNPHPDDPWFQDLTDAMERASSLHNATHWTRPVAVWDDRDEIAYLRA